MVRPSRPPAARRLTAEVTVGGEAFSFPLQTRPLALGPDTRVDYYWMDSGHFRSVRSRARNPAPFRDVVGLWWAAMREGGWDRDADEIRHLVLATSHALTAGSKSLQRVYRDAHLAPGMTAPEADSLPDDVRASIAAAVRGRDVSAVRAAFDAALAPPAPAPEMVPALRTMFDGFTAQGVDLVRRRGADGLHEFVGKLDGWATRTRRKGGRPLERTFLNLFAYEAKVRFYTCYSNAWIALTAWLRDRQALDPASERFLRVWHMQAQPVARPGGGTDPDVLAGQVLSLHPLSGFFMKDEGLTAVAGRFVGTPAYDRVFVDGRADEPAYWDLVGAVLTAAHLYRRALDRQAGGRAARTITVAAPVGVTPADDRSPLDLLTEFAAVSGRGCPGCGTPVRVLRCVPDGNHCTLETICPGGHPSTHRVSETELRSGLLRDR